MGNSRSRTTNTRDKQSAQKNNSHEFFARTGMTMFQAGRNKRDENAAECRELQTIERRHSNAARSRDVALARCEEEVRAR